MRSLHSFFRRNFYSISGAVVVSGVYVSFGQLTDAVVGYLAGITMCTLIMKILGTQ